MTYRLCDLGCGAGGASAGYAQAGFEVFGVDIVEQPHYPFTFMQFDMTAITPLWLTQNFDAVSVSPPCQGYSVTRHFQPDVAARYPRLIEPVRELLKASGLPYVIENVVGAPLVNPVWLCGCHFDLHAYFNGYRYELRRLRGFETNWHLESIDYHWHTARSIPVFGNGCPGNRPDLRGLGYAQASRDAMGIQWMNRDELDEAIPPAYTRYVGNYLENHLDHNV